MSDQTRAERDCLALAVQFALQWKEGAPVGLREGIEKILATMPAAVEKDTREGESTPRPAGTCGRALSTGKPCPDHPGQQLPALTVYRASHDSIVMGLYTSREAAREHCETLTRREVGPAGTLGWIPDDGSPDAPEELSVFGPDGDAEGPDETCTGYVVTPLEIASKYDPEADE
ncbi:hypothetical protein [Streptomyces sp. NPDC019507]|uniref:hypothetical protein n=1 Tax=Streptomyces sp. NPDC019507 TaxID=3154689 RepID=UPI0033D9339A